MRHIVSDTHFYHENIIRFDGRPFATIEEMNQTLIDNWNAVVHPTDTVYVLGDMFFKAKNEQVVEVLDKLNGEIIYVWGNHERELKRNPEVVKKYFKETHDYLVIPYTYQDTTYRLTLGHYPIPMFDGHFRNKAIHFYGHVHGTEEQFYAVYQQLMNFSNSNVPETHMMLNVGVMMKIMGYEPKPVNYVIEKAKEQSIALHEYFTKDCKGVLPTLEEFRKQTHLYLY